MPKAFVNSAQGNTLGKSRTWITNPEGVELGRWLNPFRVLFASRRRTQGVALG